ncbi:Ubiquitin thioesterase OTUB1 [Seminavis robusta]|uniref:ubiquitinyl hydrolase 1 n=1 Tax=Seminavis robusta TaxID=568900 RepID=A0A9N8HPC5_9STRA|nr:Ubiquitin thioesterase OTUB1 [Seminavis robusta]|eukprot:Sro1313_g261900.1 Ubiquitin thioesterase OTUB1 (275) ;mRNA; r:10801-11767
MADNPNSDTSNLEVNHEKFKQTQDQMETIAAEIRQEQALTSDLMPVSQLRVKANYEAGSNFDKGVSILEQDYQGVRTIRGDGNCYYRAFLYSLCEKLFQADKDELTRIQNFAKNSAQKVVKEGGYDETAIEIFHESLVDLITSIVDKSSTQQAIHKELLEENSTSDYCTWYMRVLSGTQLKAEPDRFLPYLEDAYVDVHVYCQKAVEPMGQECTMVTCLALAEAFEVKVAIVYLDGHDIPSNNKLSTHQFGPDNAKTCLTLLYRPGHYDILYPK